MPYPISPFADSFNSEVITALGEEIPETTISNEDYKKTLRWLCSAPKITTYRVNMLKVTPWEMLEAIKDYICQNAQENISVYVHPLLSNVLVINYEDVFNTESLKKHCKEVIVDVDCAAAILRGAHIFAPGVMAMLSDTKVNDNVSIYADASKKCKKGLQKLYEDNDKIFIGNGHVRMTRHELFGDKLNPSGIAVHVTQSISGCPPLGNSFIPPGWALLQNLPSVLCVHALNPQPNEKIIDLCASPGNKTTHIAELMQNKGTLVAIDKTPNKVAQLRQRCTEFFAEVHIYQADSSKIVHREGDLPKCIEDGPPFLPETFDRVLLDAPCSALGKRPQFANRDSEKVIKSYIPLQRRLFESAVKLLKVQGRMVYSTCTITLAENEGIVAWALRNFKCLRLVKPSLSLGGSGWHASSLTEEERSCVQRFGPDQDVDSVGFFFACFIKEGNL